MDTVPMAGGEILQASGFLHQWYMSDSKALGGFMAPMSWDSAVTSRAKPIRQVSRKEGILVIT